MYKFKIGVCLVLFFSNLAFFLTQYTPMVSVVMPVYNREDLVGNSIQSVLNQSFNDFELILVDDGSTDKTLQILKEYQQKDQRIKIFVHPHNKGVSEARNTAQSKARGKYLLIMDSDDLLYPHAMKKLVEAMEENPEYHILNGKFKIKRENFDIPNEPFTKYRLNHKEEIFPICMLFHSCYVNVSSIIRRDFIMKHNIKYNPLYTIGEDYDYFLQAILAGARLGTLDDNLFIIRRGHSSLMGNDTKRHIDDPVDIKQKLNKLFHSKVVAKMEYSEEEKCDLIDSFIKTNEQENILDDYTLRAFFDIKCDIENKKKIALIHPYWRDTFILQSETRAYRLRNLDFADYTLNENRLFLKWDNWGQEEFVYDAEKEAFVLDN